MAYIPTPPDRICIVTMDGYPAFKGLGKLDPTKSFATVLIHLPPSWMRTQNDGKWNDIIMQIDPKYVHFVSDQLEFV